MSIQLWAVHTVEFWVWLRGGSWTHASLGSWHVCTYLGVLLAGHSTQTRGRHVCATDGLDLFNTTELWLGKQLQSNDNYRYSARRWPESPALPSCFWILGHSKGHAILPPEHAGSRHLHEHISLDRKRRKGFACNTHTLPVRLREGTRINYDVGNRLQINFQFHA